MNKSRIELCEDCQNSLQSHEENEIHEICSSGICMLCFQSEKIDCENYKPIYHSLIDSLDKCGTENLYHDLDVDVKTKGFVKLNPDGAIFKYSFIPITDKCKV